MCAGAISRVTFATRDFIIIHICCKRHVILLMNYINDLNDGLKL